MAEFGINATQLSAPQGAGASPVAGVQTPASNALAYSIPAGLTQVLGAGIKTLFEKEDPSKEIIAKYTRQTNALADALKQGAMTSTEVLDRKQALFREFSSSNPELIKEFQDIAGWTSKYSGFEQAEQELKLEQEREADFRTRAANVGFFIDDNTDPATRNKIQEFLSELNYTNATLSSMQQQQTLLTAQDSYQNTLVKREQEERVKEITSATASSMFSAFNAQVSNLQERVASGDPSLNPEEAINLVKSQSAMFQEQITQLEIVDPERANAIRRTLELLTDNAVKMFDPNTSADIKQGLIKNSLNSAQIVLLGDNTLVGNAAAQELFSNTDILAIRGAGAILNGVNDLMTTFDNPFAKPKPMVGLGEKVNEKGVYAGFKQSIDAWRDNASSPNSKKWEGMLKEGANNILEQFGDLVTSRKATPNDYVAALDFMQSPQFRDLATSGGLDAEAISGAETALIYGFRESQAVRGQFNEKLRKTYEAPKVGSPLVGALLPEAESFQYLDVVKPVFDKASGTLSFAVEDKFKGSLISRNSVNEVINEFDNTKKSLNLSIRAHANLLGMDVGEYWETYKHEILREFYPNPELLKVGQEVNGKRYIGGPPSRKSSWELVTGGKDE